MPSITEEWKAGKPAPGWREVLAPEFHKPYMKNIIGVLDSEKAEHAIYPEPKNIFRAFSLTDYPDVKVCILGQDPYHTPNTANGLAFSVNDGRKLPPSLENIYKEIEDDIGRPPPKTGNLDHWARQGVFLLNTSLTVRAGEANSHSKIGWDKFTGRAIEALSEREDPVVFLLWGKNAKAHASLIQKDHHVILKAPHPSPFSAHYGFFGCKHFSRTNAFLRSIGKEEIDWCGGG